MTPEGRIKLRVKRLLKEYEPDLYYEMPVPSGFGKAGLDFHCCFWGYYFAVETKAPGKGPTPRQALTIKAIMRSRGSVFVIDSDKGVEQLRLWLLEKAKEAGGFVP
jgi:hypothetical protein